MVAQRVAPRGQPVADLIEPSVQPGGADDPALLALVSERPTVQLGADGLVPAVNPCAHLAQHRAVAVAR
jgi:hypothetical protein